MIRPFTFLCMLAAIGSGMYLYTAKHSAELLDRQISKAIHETEAARERTGLLRAEWALLNEPGRLQNMADTYLALKPMAPTQFVQMADLGKRLPAPLPPNQQPTGGTDDDAPAVAADINPTPSPADPGLSDAPAAPGKAVVAKAAPKAAMPGSKQSRVLAHAAQHRSAHPVAVANGDGIGRDNPLAHSSPLPLATPQPAGARVMSAMARPIHSGAGSWSRARPAVVTATPSALGAGTYVGSALAGRGSLPPPVPLGAQ
jgi:hypothetical protein